MKVGLGSRVGRVKVDEGGAYFSPGFWPIREGSQEDLIVRWREGEDPVGVGICSGWPWGGGERTGNPTRPQVGNV